MTEYKLNKYVANTVDNFPRLSFFFAFYVHSYHSKIAQLLSVFICFINAEYSLLTQNEIIVE